MSDAVWDELVANTFRTVVAAIAAAIIAALSTALALLWHLKVDRSEHESSRQSGALVIKELSRKHDDLLEKVNLHQQQAIERDGLVVAIGQKALRDHSGQVREHLGHQDKMLEEMKTLQRDRHAENTKQLTDINRDIKRLLARGRWNEDNGDK